MLFYLGVSRGKRPDRQCDSGCCCAKHNMRINLHCNTSSLPNFKNLVLFIPYCKKNSQFISCRAVKSQNVYVSFLSF